MSTVQPKQQPDSLTKQYQGSMQDPNQVALGNMLSAQQGSMDGLNDPNDPLRQKYQQKQTGLLGDGSLNPPMVIGG